MRIAIVDDNETNLLLLRHIAGKAAPGNEIDTYNDSVQARDRFEIDPPDLVLVDYMMPKLDGMDLLVALRAQPNGQDIPVIMVTAVGERAVRQRALDAGATDFLTKPIDPHEVAARLKNLIALRRSHMEVRNRNAWLAEAVKQATAEIAEREQELVVRLCRAAEFRDPETGGHILRMAHYSCLIARTLGLGAVECDLVLGAAPMHDIGKIGIPDGILLKPGPLSPEEIDIMRRHPQIGHDLLADSPSQLMQVAAEIALSHHEKFDGTGYPHGLMGNDIHHYGRIVAVADVFDALTTARPYKRPWELDRAKEFLLERSGTHFDPECVRHFIAAWDEVREISHRFRDDDLPLETGVA